jgi:uncharacterized protein YjbI with pentapeptide repeats
MGVNDNAVNNRTTPRLASTFIRLLGLTAIVLAIAAAGYVAGSRLDFPRISGPSTGFHGKTIWDWLELLVIPAALALAALWFTKKQADTALLLAERRAAIDRQLGADRAEEDALHSYFDRMSQLILENQLDSARPNSNLQAIAEARTLTTLRRLNPERQGLLIRFLSSSHLITLPRGSSESLIRLAGADLPGVQLQGAWLLAADLGEANLQRADFSKAVLLGAMLFGSDLSGADMRHTVLRDARLETARLVRATLEGAFLQGANLALTDFTDADLSGADLTGADMLGANLTRAKVSQLQLDSAKRIEGATMPDGSKHK